VKGVFARGVDICYFDKSLKAFVLEIEGNTEIKSVDFEVEI